MVGQLPWGIAASIVAAATAADTTAAVSGANGTRGGRVGGGGGSDLGVVPAVSVAGGAAPAVVGAGGTGLANGHTGLAGLVRREASPAPPAPLAAAATGSLPPRSIVAAVAAPPAESSSIATPVANGGIASAGVVSARPSSDAVEVVGATADGGIASAAAPLPQSLERAAAERAPRAAAPALPPAVVSVEVPAVEPAALAPSAVSAGEAANHSTDIDVYSASDLIGRGLAARRARGRAREHAHFPWQALVIGSAGFSLAEAAFAGMGTSGSSSALEAARQEALRAESDDARRHLEDAATTSSTRSVVGGILTLLFVAAFIFGAFLAYQKFFMRRDLPSRLNEIPRSIGAGGDLWKSSKAKQTYRKSVLEAQAKNSDSEDDDEPAQAGRESATASSGGMGGAVEARQTETYRDRIRNKATMASS